MKKLLFIAGVAAACTAFADGPETVAGTTEVGMLEIRSAAKNCIVAVPWLELTGGNICVSNIVKTANLAVNDELYVYNGSWTAWVLKEGAGGAKYWLSVGTAKIGTDGLPTHGDSGAASDARIAPGGAVWLTRPNPSLSAPFYVYGGYTSGVTTSVSANTKTLVANPKAESVNIVSKFTPSVGDTIWFLGDDGVAMTQYIYGTKKNVGTGWFTKSGNAYSTTTVTVPDLAAGCGVWMKLAHDAEITW